MTEIDAVRVVKGSTYLVTQSVVTSMIGAVALAFIARILTRAEMGVTVALTLTLGMAQVLSDLGFSGGLTKYVAEYRGKNADYTFISFGAVLMKTLTAGSAAALCFLTAPWLSGLLLRSTEYAFLFQLLAVNLLMLCMRITVNNLLLGVNRIREMAILNVISTLIGKTFAVALLMFGFGLVGLVIGWILGELAYMILGATVIVRNKYVRVHPIREVVPSLKMLARFSWPLFLTSIVVFLYGWFDRALLLAYIPLSEVAVYSVALQAFTVLSVIPLALSTTLFPYYSEQYGRDEEQKIVAGVRGASRYIALLYTPLALGLVVIANPVITLFAGPAYANGDVILAILSLFGGISGIAAALGGLLLVYNMTPTVLLINIASAGGSMAISAVFLPSLGAIGMAIIKGAAMIVSLVLTVTALRKRITIKFDKEAFWKSWSAAIIMFVTVWLIEQIYFTLYLLPIYILVGAVTYAGALRILKAVNKSDLQLIQRLTGKRVAPLVDVLEKILM